MTGGWNKNTMLAATYPVLLFNSLGKYAGIGYDYSAALRIWINAGTEDITSTTPVVNILNTGNVGIGTVSPIRDLMIGDLASVSTATPKTFSLGGTYSNSAGSNVKLRVYEDGSAIGGMSVSGGQMEVNTWSTGQIAFYRGTTQSMIINTSGNLGIGTDNPGRRLDVREGNVQIVANFQNTNTTSSRIKFTDANTGAENVNIGATGTSLAMWTNNTVRMTILSGGNVGIGTTNPTHLLHVNGTLRVDNAGSAPASTATDPGSISRYYGQDPTYYLADPPAWLAINVGGTAYVIPLYTV